MNRTTTIIRYGFIILLTMTITSVFAFYFYPRILEATIASDGLSAHDISHITVHMSSYHQPDKRMPIQEKTFTRENITDQRVIGEVLVTLSNHKMRRAIGSGPYYFPVDPDEPGRISLFLAFTDPSRSISVSIFHNEKFVSIGAQTYVLYGEGIDTMTIRESIERL